MSLAALIVVQIPILLLLPQIFGVKKVEPQRECVTAAPSVGGPIACLDACEQEIPLRLVACIRGVDEGRTS